MLTKYLAVYRLHDGIVTGEVVRFILGKVIVRTDDMEVIVPQANLVHVQESKDFESIEQFDTWAKVVYEIKGDEV